MKALNKITEFTKVTVSLSTSVLTLFIGYFVVRGSGFSWLYLVPLIFLLSSIILGMYGFGRSITAMQANELKSNSDRNDGEEKADKDCSSDSTEITQYRNQAVLYANIAVGALVAGILSVLIISLPPFSSDSDVSMLSVLNKVETQTSSMGYELNKGKCFGVSVSNDVYHLNYRVDTRPISVVYDKSQERIIYIGSTPSQ